MWSKTLVQRLIDRRDLGRSDHGFNVIVHSGIANFRLVCGTRYGKYMGSKLHTLSCDDTQFQLALNVGSAV